MPLIVRSLITSWLTTFGRTLKPLRTSVLLDRSFERRNLVSNRCRTLSIMAELVQVTADKKDPPYGKASILGKEGSGWNWVLME